MRGKAASERVVQRIPLDVSAVSAPTRNESRVPLSVRDERRCNGAHQDQAPPRSSGPLAAVLVVAGGVKPAKGASVLPEVVGMGRNATTAELRRLLSERVLVL